jgi:hypothetical protein
MIHVHLTGAQSVFVNADGTRTPNRRAPRSVLYSPGERSSVHGLENPTGIDARALRIELKVGAPPDSAKPASSSAASAAASGLEGAEVDNRNFRVVRTRVREGGSTRLSAGTDQPTIGYSSASIIGGSGGRMGPWSRACFFQQRMLLLICR